ncbi:MAG: histidine phosphatase family protein [Acidimicrobiales bacterium]
MIILVRHGRTDANARGLLLGRADPVLDDEGRLQAARLAAALGPLDGARLVTSPLARCRQTAEAIAAASAQRVTLDVDEAWIELDYGAFDGLGTGDVPAAAWAAWRADVGWTPEGGESLAALGARVRSACESLADEARERDVVVVTHVSPVKAAVAWALGVGDEVAWRMWVGPASISRIGFAGSSPSLRSFNEVMHLT